MSVMVLIVKVSFLFFWGDEIYNVAVNFVDLTYDPPITSGGGIIIRFVVNEYKSTLDSN